MSLSSSKSGYANTLKQQLKTGMKNLSSVDKNQKDAQLDSLCGILANSIINTINDWLQANKKIIAVNPGTHTEAGTGSGVDF